MTARREKLEFLRLGHSPEGASGWPHPVSICVHPSRAATLLNLSMGPHIVNVGGQREVGAVIVQGEFNETYAEEFDACDARWLIPYLARLAAGEDVSPAELVTAYVARHGSSPERESSVRHLR